MTPYALSGLALAMLVLAASPGPGVLTTVTRAVTSGFRSALAVIVGIVLGDVVFLLLAIYGLSMVAQALGEFFTIVKICGGVYLIWLGCRAWIYNPAHETDNPGVNSSYGARGFISGLLVTLSNPKGR